MNTESQTHIEYCTSALLNMDTAAAPVNETLAQAEVAKHEAETILWKQNGRLPYESELNAAKQKRQSAMEIIGRCRSELQRIYRGADSFRKGIRDGEEAERAAKLHAEYAAVTLTDLRKAAQITVFNIKVMDTQLVKVNAEQVSLKLKRSEALEADNFVTAANDASETARAALDKKQVAAFIAGKDEDFTALQAQVLRAGEHLETMTRNASAARAALPHLAELLEANDAERTDLERMRNEHIAEWWSNRKRQEGVIYRETYPRLISTALVMQALDQMTVDKQGLQLLDGLRAGLRTPVPGGFTQMVSIGNTAQTDVDSTLSRLQAELDAAIQAGIKKPSVTSATL